MTCLEFTGLFDGGPFNLFMVWIKFYTIEKEIKKIFKLISEFLAQQASPRPTENKILKQLDKWCGWGEAISGTVSSFPSTLCEFSSKLCQGRCVFFLRTFATGRCVQRTEKEEDRVREDEESMKC